MKRISDLSHRQLKGIQFLLTDIDDTMTEDGLLPSSSLSAIERLDNVGIAVLPITGRPAGWCDHIARMWSVKAVVGENGAFYFSYDHSTCRMVQVFAKNEHERERDRARLCQIKDRILKEVPGAGVASDQNYRVADLAIDFCEDVEPLSDDQIKLIVGIFEKFGATAKISSIHVNGWFGSYDKLTMTRRCLQDLFDIDIEEDNEQIAFIGDSPNDGPMFAFFKNSVGVANVADFDLDPPPHLITKGRSARGFAEFAELLINSRTAD